MYQLQSSRYGHAWLLLLLILIVVPSQVLAQESTGIESVNAVAQSGWEQYPGAPSVALYAVDFLDATDGWIGGQAAYTLHYAGEWVSVANNLSNNPIRGIDMVSSSDVWAVGWMGMIAHYNGASWQEISNTPEVSSLDDVAMVDAGNGWAVGTSGTILRYAGGTWSPVPSPTDSALKAIDMLNANDGWAVGMGGVFLHWNGSAWQIGDVISDAYGLYDVKMVSPTDGWAVGGSGRIFHYNGSEWLEVPSPTTNTLQALAMVSATEGWAVGDSGTIVRYNGHSWVAVDSPTSQTLMDIVMVGAAEGWAVGRFGVIIHYTAQEADLSTSHKLADKLHASAGDEVRYDVVLTNSGGLPTSEVTVTDALNLGLVSYVPGSATITKPTGTISGPNPLVATIPEILPGETVTLSFRVTLLAQDKTCWAVPNAAVVSTGDTQFTVRSATLVGTCAAVYLPIALK